MTVSFQPFVNNDNSTTKTDSLNYTTHPDNPNILIVGRSNNNPQPQQPDFLKDCTPGTTEKEDIFGNTKVKITTTTTIDKVNEDTVITIVEESKYHKITKTRIIHPDNSQEIRTDRKNKVKICKMPQGFSQKYLSTSVKLGELKELQK